jgi:hypothetical protein
VTLNDTCDTATRLRDRPIERPTKATQYRSHIVPMQLHKRAAICGGREPRQHRCCVAVTCKPVGPDPLLPDRPRLGSLLRAVNSREREIRRSPHEEGNAR